ncbi:MAG TPA: outer membrane protein [Bauldia sp.]|nr:outer membrane protein [Bauldia sp.]
MGSFSKWALLGAFALIVPNAQAALAADMPETPVIALPPATPAPFGSWYLRGDIGYKKWSTPQLTFYNDNGSFIDYDNEALGNAWLVGIGFGKQISQWFRADFTLDYETPSTFTGTVFCGTCTPTYTSEYARVSAWTLLANAYVDLPLFGEGPRGITPYVGAGIGVSRVTWADYTSTCGGCVTTVSDYGTTSTWRFAWALTAGASFNITNRLLLDANYRFLSIAKGTAVAAVGSPSFGHSDYKNLYAHEFRLGLRYLFN